ncbi:helix-turn-helix domain-containing protein [bacterium]|nr:helix-turn-helix domain-containing protein [bacterium]
MPDNFDINVARRKPSTAKNRPARPWDVPKTIVDDVDDDFIDDSQDNSVVIEHEIIPEAEKPTASAESSLPVTGGSSSGETDITPVFVSKITERVFSRKQSDLSDTINIHSNFCKLDNDVSDHLFARLSPSAQSVYLRLYRQSFGWNRNWAAESLPKLKVSCNLSLQTVRKAIKELETTGCIKKEFSDYHKATVYRIFLPSEIGMSDNAPQYTDSQNKRVRGFAPANSSNHVSQYQGKQGLPAGVQNTDSDSFSPLDLKNLDGHDMNSGGQNSFIQSVYYSGTNIYTLLGNGGALPKNISKYITDTSLAHAVDIIDEFYESIGFSIVSRAAYRKSIFDFFDMIRSGFSPDDIRYAVRWTFKNSRSRPESFSLVKYTIHDAMNELIQEMKGISGEKEFVREKQEAMHKKQQLEKNQVSRTVTNEDIKIWIQVMDELKTVLNEHSFSAFIEPLKLDAVEGDRISISAPPDSVSWVVDHFLSHIQDAYRNHGKKNTVVEIN